MLDTTLLLIYEIHLILADCIRGSVGGDLGGLDHLLGRSGAAESTTAPEVQ